MLPPKVKNYQVLNGAVLEHLADRGVFSGIGVEDHLDPNDVVKRQVKIAINRIVEDSKGLPNPTCCKTCPAAVGTCPFCKIRGVTVFKRPCYIGAVTHLLSRCVVHVCVCVCV